MIRTFWAQRSCEEHLARLYYSPGLVFDPCFVTLDISLTQSYDEVFKTFSRPNFLGVNIASIRLNHKSSESIFISIFRSIQINCQIVAQAKIFLWVCILPPKPYEHYYWYIAYTVVSMYAYSFLQFGRTRSLSKLCIIFKKNDNSCLWKGKQLINTNFSSRQLGGKLLQLGYLVSLNQVIWQNSRPVITALS